MTVRVGHIRFLNCYPLYYGLERCGVLAEDRRCDQPGRPGIELHPGVPTELNSWLVDGRIDLGLISSIAYGRNHRHLLLSRNVSISSFGAVDSIQLVTRRPLEEIETIALTRQSATSVALLKTLFKLRFRRQVGYGGIEGSVAEALRHYDAALLIGDQGLEALYFPEPDTTCHDLGALWQEWTGLPMVYAVSAAREDFARTNGEELVAVEHELAGCVEYGRTHLDEVVDSAVGLYRFDRASLTRYFALLRYDFTEEYQRGLRRFYELAHEAGELDEVPELRFIDEVAGAPPTLAGAPVTALGTVRGAPAGPGATPGSTPDASRGSAGVAGKDPADS